MSDSCNTDWILYLILSIVFKCQEKLVFVCVEVLTSCWYEAENLWRNWVYLKLVLDGEGIINKQFLSVV
jgi:hypothetical protein